MTCRISRFQDGGSLNNYITIFLAEGIWKVHIFRHLFVYFQTSVYTLGEFHKNRNNSTIFEELSVSIVDLTVANICFTGSASRRQQNGICDRQIHNSPPTLQIQYCYSLILLTCGKQLHNSIISPRGMFWARKKV